MSLFTRACLPPLALALGLAGCTEDAKNGGKETSSTGGEDTSTDSGDDTAWDSGDDTDASTYPGAEEVCGDGVVNDCDVAGTAAGEAAAAGACLGGEQSLSAATDVLEGASVGSRAGISVAAAADVNGDGVDDVLVGDYGTKTARGVVYAVSVASDI